MTEHATNGPCRFRRRNIAVLQNVGLCKLGGALLSSPKKVLQLKCDDSAGTQVHDLVESVRKVRMTKIHSGLKSLAGPMTVKLNNLSAMECNLMRGLFQGALDRFWKLAQVISLGSVTCAS